MCFFCLVLLLLVVVLLPPPLYVIEYYSLCMRAGCSTHTHTAAHRHILLLFPDSISLTRHDYILDPLFRSLVDWLLLLLLFAAVVVIVVVYTCITYMLHTARCQSESTECMYSLFILLVFLQMKTWCPGSGSKTEKPYLSHAHNKFISQKLVEKFINAKARQQQQKLSTKKCKSVSV